MPTYPDLIARILLQPDLMTKLTPTEVLGWDLVERVKTADDAALTGGVPVSDAAMLTLVRGALLNAVDALEAAHKIFQDDTSDVGSYWHGVMHRREGDFENARYWFRRAGLLPFFAKMHAAAIEDSPTMAKQDTWDAYLFTGLCEQVRFGAPELNKECLALQRVEFEGLLSYCWRQAVGEK